LGNKTLISFIYPKQNEVLLQQFQTQKSTVLAMDLIPRTLSRGQTYDALSSQANIAGYRAVLEASNEFGRFFAGQMTAAGKVPPAKGTFFLRVVNPIDYCSIEKMLERKMCVLPKRVPHQTLSRSLFSLFFCWLLQQSVLVIGTGVAGLAAIQTAKNMGAIVRAFDVRPVTKEQVEAMGGHFLTVDYQEDGSAAGGYAKEMSNAWHAAARAMLTKQCADVDIVITTALIPGRKAPIMITKEMVAVMKNGSVTVDLAAETGGNIETTVPDARIVTDQGVICLGYTDLPSRLATTSSTLYANNISKLLLSAGPQTTKEAGYFYLDHADEAVRGMLTVENGKLMYPAPLPPAPVISISTDKKGQGSRGDRLPKAVFGGCQNGRLHIRGDSRTRRRRPRRRL
jgi:H+-translocating NAD(P) transhydrogenase